MSQLLVIDCRAIQKVRQRIGRQSGFDFLFGFVHDTADICQASVVFRMLCIALADVVFPFLDNLTQDFRIAVVLPDISDNVTIRVAVTVANEFHRR